MNLDTDANYASQTAQQPSFLISLSLCRTVLRGPESRVRAQTWRRPQETRACGREGGAGRGAGAGVRVFV